MHSPTPTTPMLVVLSGFFLKHSFRLRDSRRLTCFEFAISLVCLVGSLETILLEMAAMRSFASQYKPTIPHAFLRID
jgi:hypothetical protein